MNRPRDVARALSVTLSRQRDVSLRSAPFEPDQIDALYAGALPRGRL